MTAAYAVLTVRGGREALLAELAELGITATGGGVDWVECALTPDLRTAILLHSQLALRLLALHGIAKDREALTALAKAARPTGSFAVRASGPDRQELQEEIGGTIKDASNAKVNLSAPDETYLVLDCDGTYLFGVDAGGELGKRHYKIITGTQSLAGPVAAALLRRSGWTPKQDLVTWPCTTGELPIEAALWASRKSPRAYELRHSDSTKPDCEIIAADPKLAMVSSAQKNAKIAGVNAFIRFSRQDLDWLDTKHEERGVNFMVGLLPNLKLQPGFVKELFYQLDFILAKGGIACFACVNDDSAERLEAGLAIAERAYEPHRDYIWSGQHAYTVVTLTAKGARAPKRKKTSAPALTAE